MPKNIVLLLDGTSNEISSKRTNVLRLYGCLKKTDDQVVYYDPGVGTLGLSWSKRGQQLSEVWGMATGFGLDQNVKDAYRFLVENYVAGTPGQDDGDRIYIFGFSRGAYQARVLAGFIHNLGLIEPRNLNLLDYAYRAYKRIGEAESTDAFAEIRLYERMLNPVRPTIRLLGLFDTVASVIEPGPRIWPQLKSHASTSKNPSVEAVRHAVALDERRRMFRALLWPGGQDFRPDRFSGKGEKTQDEREVWFTGAHGDIGGGAEEEASALPKISLDWMIQETAPMGLDYDMKTVDRIVLGKEDGSKYVKPDADAPRYDSMTTGWSIIENIPLPTKLGGMSSWRVTRKERRHVPPGARIHASVLARAKRKNDLPPNVPETHIVEGDPADW